MGVATGGGRRAVRRTTGVPRYGHDVENESRFAGLATMRAMSDVWFSVHLRLRYYRGWASIGPTRWAVSRIFIDAA